MKGEIEAARKNEVTLQIYFFLVAHAACMLPWGPFAIASEKSCLNLRHDR